MKLPSSLTYYTRNPRKLMLLAIPVLLCTSAIFIIQSLISSYITAQYKAFVETRKYYTAIQARGNPIRLDTLDAIAANENVQKVVPCVQDYTEMSSILDVVGVRIYLMKRDDLVELMGRMGVKLVAGRLPDPDKNEIVLHRAVATNKGLYIGSEIGNEIKPQEKLLGRYRVVGLVDGPALCGFAPLEAWQASVKIDKPQEYGVLIYAKPGKLAEINKYLQYLPLTGNELSSLDTSTGSLAESRDKINTMLNIIYVALLAIIMLCVGFLTYLFTINRAREFAILNIIGFTRRRILQSNLSAIGAISLGSSACAVLLSMGICAVLNAAVFNQTGLPLPLLDGQTLLLCACVPLLTVIAEALAATRAFGGMDAISLLDSEN
jgi:putative ABC transport system permease protein